MAQPEARLSRKIMNHLKVEFPGIFVFKVHGSEYQLAGLPDILGCVQGLFFGLETKLPEKRTNVTPRQQLTHQMIRDAEGFVRVVCSPEEAEAEIRSLLSKKS